jgi:hypothetical protein
MYCSSRLGVVALTHDRNASSPARRRQRGT